MSNIGITKLMGWMNKTLDVMSSAAFSAINRYSRPRNEISTASSIGYCDFKTAYEAQNGSSQKNFSNLVRFRVGHVFETDVALRLIAGGFLPVEPEEIFAHEGPCFCGGGDILDTCGLTAEIRKSLKNQGVLLPTEQLTLESIEDEIGANYDLVIKHRDGSYQTIECKTSADELSEPRDYWVDQIHTQLAVLKKHVPEGTSIRGSVYVRMGNDTEVEFEGFGIPDEQEWSRLRIKAKHQAAAKRGEVEGCKKPSFLCGSCPAHTCPLSAAGRSKKAIPLPNDVARAAECFATAKQLADDFAREADRNRKVLEEYSGGQRMQALAGDQIVLVSPVAGRVSINSKKLAMLVSEDVLESCSSRSKGYLKVEVKPLASLPETA